MDPQINSQPKPNTKQLSTDNDVDLKEPQTKNDIDIVIKNDKNQNDNKNQKISPSDDIKKNDDDGYFNDFVVGSEMDVMSRRRTIRASTDEFLKMKQAQFWEEHRESIEENKMIQELSEYHEQLQFMRQIQKEEQEEKQRELQQKKLIQKQEQYKKQLIIQQQQQQSQQQPQQQQQQQQQVQLNQLNMNQLQELLINIRRAIPQLQLQYTQQTQMLNNQYQQIVLNLNNSLNAAISINNKQEIASLQLQCNKITQTYQSQIQLINNNYTKQIQQFKINEINILNQINTLKMKEMLNNNNVPVFIPSSQVNQQSNMNNNNNNRPHIVDDNDKKHVQPDLNRKTSRGDNEHILNDDKPVPGVAVPLTIRDINHSQSFSTINTQNTQKSNTKSPTNTITNIISPSISPMKLSHSAVSSPNIMPVAVAVGGIKTFNNRINTLPVSIPASNNTSATTTVINNGPHSLPLTSIKSSPIPAGFAELSAVSLTPEFKAMNSKKKTEKNTKKNKKIIQK